MTQKPRKILILLLSGLLLMPLLLKASPALAACCSCACNCVQTENENTRIHVTEQFQSHQGWLIDVFWYDNVLPAMMRMTTQLSAVAMQQVMIIGTFMDAKMQMETQQLLQELQAKAHKDYHPSEGLCSLGTGVRSLASSERKGELNSLVLSQRMIDRHMRNEHTVAADPSNDVKARLDQYKATYCNPTDNGGALENFCPTAANPDRINADINYAQTIAVPLTLEMDFSAGTAPVETEQDVLAVANNLFGSEVLTTNFNLDEDDVDNKREEFLLYRSLVAQRNVAQHSFNHLVGMKSSGSGIGAPELRAILEELGIPAPEAQEMIGLNPSYYAQMELLSKKIFQNPNFYVNLYDKPANVQRKAVALQALELMLLNETFNSDLRTEMLMALILERELDIAQEGIQSDINPN